MFVQRVSPHGVGINEDHDFDGRDLCLDGLGVFEIIVPELIDNVAKKFSDTAFSRLVTGIVVEAGFMSCLCVYTNDCCGIIGNIFTIEGEANGLDKLGVAMAEFVFDSIHKDGSEGVYSY
jgi:hypothetical protein